MAKSLKDSIGLFLVPLARMYIRYSPISKFKWLLWKTFGRLEKTYTARTTFGSKMKGSSTDLVQGYIYYFGIWEPNLTYFVKSRLQGQGNRTFIDVGANVGYFSLLAGRFMQGGRVVSIEAFPTIFRKLEENIIINNYKNIRAVNLAAAEGVHPVSMYHASNSNEGATTSKAGVFDSVAVEVEGLPLSDILTDSEIETVRLVKIDVEGAENSVLRGMYTLLPQFPKDAEIVVEITPFALGEKGMAEIFTTFENEGFFPYELENKYSAKYYLYPQEIHKPTRMKAYPLVQTDIIFSRIDQEYLSL